MIVFSCVWLWIAAAAWFVAARSCSTTRAIATVRPSAACEGQPECGHLFAVANEQNVANQDRVVPRLALDRRESRELSELIRSRPDECQLTFLRQHQQQILVGQQRELAVAVASALP